MASRIAPSSLQGTSQQQGQGGGASPPLGSEGAARVLTARIMAASNWQALSALLAELGGDLNPIHCAALVHRASRLCQGGLAKVTPASDRTRLAATLNSVLQVSAYSLEEHRPQVRVCRGRGGGQRRGQVAVRMRDQRCVQPSCWAGASNPVLHPPPSAPRYESCAGACHRVGRPGPAGLPAQ